MVIEIEYFHNQLESYYDSDGTAEASLVMVFTMVALLIWFSNGHLIVLHIYLRFIGITTYEFIIQNRKKASVATEKHLPREMRLTPRQKRTKRKENKLDLTQELDTTQQDLKPDESGESYEKIPPVLRMSLQADITHNEDMQCILPGSSYISI